MTPALDVTVWTRFNLVGAIGAAVQLAVLFALSTLGLGYATATVLAVEAAVLHNFFWHRRWTWPDAVFLSRAEAARRLAAFNLTVGMISIFQNVGIMRVLVEHFDVHYLIANAIAIALASFANFGISHRWVFATNRPARARLRRICS